MLVAPLFSWQPVCFATEPTPPIHACVASSIYKFRPGLEITTSWDLGVVCVGCSFVDSPHIASSRSTTEMEKLVGVVISSFSDEGFAALKWARDFLKLPDTYKLCIIRIVKQNNIDPRRDSFFKNWDEIEGGFKKDAGDDWIDKFQNIAQDFSKKICAQTYVGKTFQETLQFAANDKKAEMDTLVIGAGSQAAETPIELKLSGCSVVLVKIDPGKTLSLSTTASPATTEPQQEAAPPSAPPKL